MRTSKGCGDEPRDNPEAERAVLGAILIDSSVLDRVDDLRAEHFSEPSHQRIFTTMVDLRRNPDRQEGCPPVDSQDEAFLALYPDHTRRWPGPWAFFDNGKPNPDFNIDAVREFHWPLPEVAAQRVLWFRAACAALTDLRVPARLSILSRDEGYASSLLCEASSAPNVPEYAQIIRDAAAARASATQVAEAA